MKESLNSPDKGGLVLGLYPGDHVEIDTDIRIYLHEVKGNWIWLRLIAPKEMKINRRHKTREILVWRQGE
jgi:sRNA-binding carbon storage regulator CsrA